jgi:hypothetical protein
MSRTIGRATSDSIRDAIAAARFSCASASCLRARAAAMAGGTAAATGVGSPSSRGEPGGVSRADAVAACATRARRSAALSLSALARPAGSGRPALGAAAGGRGGGRPRPPAGAPSGARGIDGGAGGIAAIAEVERVCHLLAV